MFSLIVFVLTAEAGSFLVTLYLQQRGILYTPHEDISDYDDYLRNRHPVLGWTKLSDEDNPLPDGTRNSPAVSGGVPCVSLYGDSFVWADEVDDAHAWGNLLAERLGCRVANYGVRAYGTDQSYLRYLEHPAVGDGNLVILGHLTENVLRNVSQDFDLLYGFTKYGLKPRFVIDAAGRLELIPLPDLSSGEFSQLVHSPSKVLPHEYFVPLRAGFPYSLSLLNAIRSHRIQAKLRGEPPYAAFYRSDHPSRSLAITVEIMRAFVNEAKARAEKPLVLVIPTLLDLHHFEESGSWVYAPLVAELARHEIPFFDVGPTVFAAFQEQGIDTFFAPRSHLNAAGNRRFAGIVFKMLMARGLLPRGKGTGVQELAQGRPSAHDRAQKPEDDDRRQ